ncbi:Myelin regulatory factor [Hypsibius exemplaris]|uniref:Myelin regulatory factor n=1 Tax=Hypsibius exemplaris TaxID=2072580 RepID=A0A1W0X922_HYPEX|nr:Myelin regulatory factor [Hypsibius exemplaris]
MDQTMPNYPEYLEGASFNSNELDGYFPSYQEHTYDIPSHPNQQYMSLDQTAYSYQDPSSRSCILPDSPPDYVPNDHYSMPQLLGGSPPLPPHLIAHSPGSYPVPSPAGSSGSGLSGASSTSHGSVPAPYSPYRGSPAGPINHPSFQNGAKRMRGNNAGTIAMTCPSPAVSLKLEDDPDFPFIPAGTGPPLSVLNMGGFYQEPPFPDTSEGVHRNIEFKPIFREQWCPTVQADGKSVVITDYKVQADKGFNFSQPEEAFICQKKNHFQVTVQLGITGVPDYIQKGSLDDGSAQYHQITGFYLDLYGVKAEATHQSVKIDQSQSDRSRKEFKAYHISALNLQQQLSLGRLHFNETTQCNMRKRGKPNPDQRYFKLVVGLFAEAKDVRSGEPVRHMLYAAASENIIVRASNPGQFENDTTPVPAWQRGQNEDDAIFHQGNIGINNDRPEEALDVRGNMRLTGRMVQPSDARAKDVLGDADTTKHLENIKKMRFYNFKWKDTVVASLNLTEPYDMGILAQDVQENLPEAVEIVGDLNLEAGGIIEDFLMVNKDRLYMEGLGAVQALSLIADDYNNRLTEIERRLVRRKRDQLKSRESFRSNFSRATGQTIYSSFRTEASVSARPSIYTINPAMLPRPAQVPLQKPGGFSPRAVLGKNYVQWLTLGLVMLISVCLVTILGLYIASFAEDKMDDEATRPYHQANTGVTHHSTWHPYEQTTTTDTNHNGDGTTSLGEHTSPPSLTFQPPTLSSSPISEHVLGSLFQTGKCRYVLPIVTDQRCLTYEIDWVENNCRPNPNLDKCCQGFMGSEFFRATKAAGQSVAQTSMPNFVPELKHFPEYKTVNRARPLPRQLEISFGAKEVDSKSDGMENMVAQEIFDGQAVLVRSAHPSTAQENWAAAMDPTCNATSSSSSENQWKMVKSIYLEQAKQYLDEDYCYRQDDEACGTDNNYMIALPISKYYRGNTLKISMELQMGTVFKDCGFYILDNACDRTDRSPSMTKADGLFNIMTIPIDSHSILYVRVAPAGLPIDDICLSDSPEIYKYTFVTGHGWACK